MIIVKIFKTKKEKKKTEPNFQNQINELLEFWSHERKQQRMHIPVTVKAPFDIQNGFDNEIEATIALLLFFMVSLIWAKIKENS